MLLSIEMAADQSSLERLGEFLVRLGALTQDQVVEILAKQAEEPSKLFGQIALELGFTEHGEIDMLIERNKAD